MRKPMPTVRIQMAVIVIAVCTSILGAPPATWSQTFDQPTTPAQANTLPAIPQGKDNDLKFYDADGRIVKGREAMQRMSQANLVLWLAGNQFFAMDEVIGTFQKQVPGKSVGLITLPPGLLLQAIKAGGWSYAGTDYPGRPDVYASVNLGHLTELKRAGLMDT